MALKGQPTSSRPLWERAGAYYRQAAAVQPESGNPYNQLAVMAYFTGDELRAVYYYFRSLAVALPFVTARENLLLLFEKNRSRCVGNGGGRREREGAGAGPGLHEAGSTGRRSISNSVTQHIMHGPRKPNSQPRNQPHPQLPLLSPCFHLPSNLATPNRTGTAALLPAMPPPP